MTEQRKKFADRYFETLNGTQSAIYAGYSEATATVQASQILVEDEVQEYISKLKAEYQLKYSINKERVLNEYKKIAFSDIRNLLTTDGGLRSIDDIDDEAAGAIASIESVDEIAKESGERLGTNRKIKLHDKLRALEALSKHLGLFEKDNEQSRPIIAEKITVEIVNPKDEH